MEQLECLDATEVACTLEGDQMVALMLGMDPMPIYKIPDPFNETSR